MSLKDCMVLYIDYFYAVFNFNSMDTILTLDRELLLFLNASNTPLLDRFFWIFTSIPVWIPLYLTIAFQFIKPSYKSGLILLGGLILTFVLTDQISSGLFKNLFERWRPSHEPTLEGIVRILNGYKGGPYGFVSGHAANSFALATFVAYFLRNRWLTLTLFVWASLNGYSRIYLGVHYPGDVICGAILGITIAYGIISTLNYLEGKYLLFQQYGSHSDQFRVNYKGSYNLIVFAIVIMMASILLASTAMVKFS